MKAILIDDEEFNLRNLEIVLKDNFQEIEILGAFKSVKSAGEVLKTTPVDLIFLDVLMPEQDGFELLAMFPDRLFQVIFVTAHEEYALQALKTGATDYILKPLCLDELQVAIEKVKKNLTLMMPSQPIEISDSNTQSNKIMLTYSGGSVFIDPNELVYVHGINNMSKIIISEKRSVFLSKTLKYFEDILDSSFFRIHKSYIVNLKYIHRVSTTNDYTVTLQNGVSLPLSRRRLSGLTEVLKKQLLIDN